MKCILVCIVINGLLIFITDKLLRVKIKFLTLFLEEIMIKKIIKKLDKLKLDKSNLQIKQNELQKQIDDIDLKIKEYTSMKKDYEKLEKKYNDITQSTPKEENKNE